MVPPCSDRISRVPPYSSELLNTGFHLRDYHPVSCWFPTTLVIAILRYIHWAVPLSLAATHRISVDFFSSRYWDVSVPWVSPPHPYVFRMGYTINSVGSPIQTLSDQCLLPTPRHFSQAATSFFASDCLGIHRMLFYTWLYILKTSIQDILMRMSPFPYIVVFRYAVLLYVYFWLKNRLPRSLEIVFVYTLILNLRLKLLI